MKRYNEPLATLRKGPVLSSLKESHFEGLVKVMEPGILHTGQVLFRQGQAGEIMAVVTRGLLAVSIIDDKKRRTVLGSLGPGDVVGELAVLDPGPRAATVTALEPSKVYCFSRKKLLGLRNKGPSVAMSMVEGILGQVAQRIRRTNEQIEARLRVLYNLPESVAPDVWAAGQRHRFTSAGELVSPRIAPGDVDLAGIPDLEVLTDDDHAELKALAHQQIYPRGTVLCEEGDWGESCYIIVEGRVEVFKNVDGKPRRLGTVEPCLLGQLSLLEPAPRVATLRTSSDVVLLEFERNRWEEALRGKTWFSVRLQEVVASACVRQLRRANARLTALPRPPPAKIPIHAHIAPTPSVDSTSVFEPSAPAQGASTAAARPVQAGQSAPTKRSVRAIVEDLLGEDGDAFVQPIKRRARPRHSTMRLARVQTELLYGVDPKR